jgi:hypothetical protein
MWVSAGCTGDTNDALAWECINLAKILKDKPLPMYLRIVGDDVYKGNGQIVSPYPEVTLTQSRGKGLQLISQPDKDARRGCIWGLEGEVGDISSAFLSFALYAKEMHKMHHDAP